MAEADDAKAAAWQAVAGLAARGRSLTALFDADPERARRLAADRAGIHFDFAKTHLTRDLVAAFGALLEAADFDTQRARLFAGGVVNGSERRAATHTAERGSGSGPAIAAARTARAAQRALCGRVARGDFGDVSDIVHIGIGGSALGPALLVDALGAVRPAIGVHVVSNVDGAALERALAVCDPEGTLVIVVSKSFTTTETMANAGSACDWLAAAGVEPAARFVAVTAAPDKAAEWGVREANILAFAETVGGRYSLWSAVGVSAALALGWDAFDALHDGAAAMDRHFETAAAAENLPVLAAMVDLLYAGFLGAETRAVFAYDERLALLPAFLQQLEMESNGKSVDVAGRPLAHPSAAITWGGSGTDAQHAVFQLLHQGTHLVPAEFVMVREPGHGLGGAHHRQLLANAIAQGAALMRGKSLEQALADSNGDEALARARTFPGNRPSSAILLDRLDPRSLGALIAFYEHRTFAAAVMFGVNPFDQWGVELGKDMARAALDGTADGFDASSRALLERAFTSE